MSLESLRGLKEQVVITGAKGFIGKVLCAKLPEAKTFDRKGNYLGNPYSLKSFLKDAKIIFHLAGVNAGSGYTPSKESLRTNNIIATRNLLEAVRQFSDNKPLIVLISSIHVYSKNEKVFTESCKIEPASYYGFTKWSQELLIQQAAKSGIVEYVILRASNIYGPGCRPFYNSVIATFCEKLRRQEVLELFGNGDSQLDLVYVEDVVSILMRVDELSRSKNPIYNLSCGKSVSIREIVDILGEISDIAPNIKLINTPAVKFDTDNTKLISALTDYEFVNLRKGLEQTFHRRYSDNKCLNIKNEH